MASRLFFAESGNLGVGGNVLKDVEKMKADFSKWAAMLPPRVRDVAEQYPTWNCYR